MKNNHKHDLDLKEIWHQVPPDYYQKGVKNNLLQKAWHLKKLKTVIHLAEDARIKPKTILDVGCASGWFLSQVGKNFKDAKCTGVDVYKKAINHGNKIYKHLSLIHADAHKLPFKDKSFDLIICSEVLEHVVHPEDVLFEIRRVLKPRGLAIIEMDSGNILFQLVWYWWTHLRRGVWRDSHIHTFNTKKLRKMILDARFTIEREKQFNLSMAVAFSLRR